MSRWCFDLPVMFTETGFSQVLNRRHWKGEVGAADGCRLERRHLWRVRHAPGVQGLCRETSKGTQADMAYITEWLLSPFLPSV